MDEFMRLPLLTEPHLRYISYFKFRYNKEWAFENLKEGNLEITHKS